MDLLKDLSIDKIRNAAEDAFNQAKPKTDVEARVYEVLSHKNWGAASTIMNQIARDTYDYEKFAIITRIMWENVETQRPSAWRVIFKGLGLVEHLVKHGSERCVDDARNHGHVLRALHNFNYYEGTIDRGVGVREKSKQLVETLADNERIREERQKAKKLREKFGNTKSVASNNAGGGGYSGNDGWNSGGGYGDGGIDSGGGGRDPYSARGRYDDDRGSSPRAPGTIGTAAAPTFATMPSTKKSSKSGTKKTKKKKAEAAPAPAPEVDLFSFDGPETTTPAPAAASSGGGDDFSADFSGFQSAPAAAASNDPFGGDPFASTTASSNAVPQQQQQQQQAPDPFAAAAATPQQPDMAAMNNMFGNMGMGGMPQQAGGMMGGNNAAMMMGGANNMMGGNNMNVMGGNNSNIMGGGGGGNMMMGGAKPMGGTPAPAANNFDDDDFGDFEGAGGNSAGGQAMATQVKSSDPLANLVSLDGLSKNNTDNSRLNEPIVINAAAAQYMTDKQQGVGTAAPQNDANKTAMSFAGIDGLQKSSGNFNSMGMGSMGGGMGMAVPPSSGGMNPSVMASGGSGNASLIGTLDPASLAPPKPQTQPAAQPGAAAGMGGMNPQMMQAMMMQNPQMMQTFMANMGNMSPQQQQQMMMMMQQQMMGGGNGAGGMMGGQGNAGGQMGGQQMGGWGS